MSKSVDFWNFLISLSATVPGLYLCGFLIPAPVVLTEADFLAVLCPICFQGAFPPVCFLAACFVLAI